LTLRAGPWARLYFAVSQGLGLANLLHQSVMCKATEARFILWSIIFQGQSFAAACATLAQKRSWFETQYNWQRAMQSQSQQRLIEHGYDPNAVYEDAAQIIAGHRAVSGEDIHHIAVVD
jgi:hypothetical protein